MGAIRLTAKQARKLLPTDCKSKRKARLPKKLAAGWAVELSLPCVVRSELNQRGHWSERHRRFVTQALTLQAVLLEVGLTWTPPLPVAVTFTHVGKAMDSDNLAGAFKGLRDALCRDWLECDDADPAVSWAYRQESGTPGVRVRIEGRA